MKARWLRATAMLGWALAMVVGMSTAAAQPTPETATAVASDEERAYVLPAHGTVTYRYGKMWGRLHAGVDIEAEAGTPIVAAAAGTVAAFIDGEGAYERGIAIELADGTLTRYLGCDSFAVEVGDVVERGREIARIADHDPLRDHLHFEVRVEGDPIDPLKVLPELSVGGEG